MANRNSNEDAHEGKETGGSGKYWFRKRKGIFSKDLGYGWVPITWQGCLIIIIVIGLAIFSAMYFDLMHADISSGLGFLLSLIILMLALSNLADKKTEKPFIFKRN
jgi:hypothetical protein